MSNKILSNFIVLILISMFVFSCQQKVKDTGEFREKEKGFYDNVIKQDGEKNNEENEDKEKEDDKKEFKANLDNFNPPKSIEEFTYQWHNAPISQGNSGMCWSFSTTSYFESEVKRLQDKEVKLSELWTVYWEYIEKAKEFIRTEGESLFAQGSEANALIRIYGQYGVVPLSAYISKPENQKFHQHTKMFEDMESYLESLKEKKNLDEGKAIKKITSILDKYLGVPPTSVTVDGKDYSPKEFLTDYLKIQLDDYVDVLSYLQQPFYQQVEYEVPDNWWNSKDYYNIPLDEFMDIIKKSVRAGYTMSIGGDVSEPGKDAMAEVFVIPTFDIPSEYIDDYSRQFRFYNETTQDDHGIHLVGYKEMDGVDWYLIKDSGASSRDGQNKGYYFFHEDYVKLKIMDFMIHKDAVKDMLSKF